MAYKYTLGYRIYEVSPDGLMKHPRISYGYGDYSADVTVYETEELALESIVKHDHGACIIVRAAESQWVDD